MTINARNPRVRGLLISDVLRLHHRVARQSTKFLRILIANAVIRRCRENSHIRKSPKSKRPRKPCHSRAFCRHALQYASKSSDPSRYKEQAKRHEHETEDEYGRQYQEHNDADIRIVEMLKQ